MTAQQFIAKKKIDFEKKAIVEVKDIGREGKMLLRREAWAFKVQGNLPEKVFVIERLKKESYKGKLAYPKNWKPGAIEYRIGYYIIGRIGNTAGKWRWGQYCPFIPAEDLAELLEHARKEGVIV